MKKEEKEIIIKSDNYKCHLKREVLVKFKGGREISGILEKYDEMGNIFIKKDEKNIFCFARSVYCLIPFY